MAMAPDRTTDSYLNHQATVAAALQSIEGPESFALLRALSGQPRHPGDLVDRLGVDDAGDVWDIAVPLLAGRLVERWGGGLKLTQLGSELWGAIEPIVERG